MEENKNIDQGIKSRRERFKMDPSEDAWKRLDADLERQRALRFRQRGNRFKMLSIGLALLLVSILAYNYFTPDLSNPVSNSKAIMETPANNNTVVHEKMNKTTSGLLAENNGEMNSATTSSSSALTNNNTSKNTSVSDINTTNNPSHKRDVKSNDILSRSEDKTMLSSEKDITLSGKEKDKAIENNIPQTNSNITETTSSLKNIKGEDMNENSPQPIAVNDHTDIQNPIDNKSPETPADKIDSAQNKSLKDSILDKEKGNYSHWTLSLFYGPNVYSYNHLKILNQQYAAAIKSYNDLSTQDYSFNSGLLAGYQITKKWSIATGGLYSTIAYSSTYPTLHARVGSDNTYHYIYRTVCGSIEVPNDDNVVLTSKDSLKNAAHCSQVIKIISVPVMVKYQVTKNRFTIYATTGFAANFILQEVANVSTGTSQYTIVNHITGLRKTNYSYLVGTGIDYNLNNGMSVFAEPSFRTSITSLTQFNSFNCYPYSFGINMGLSFHFR